MTEDTATIDPATPLHHDEQARAAKGLLDAGWEKMQIKTFKAWANSHLAKRGLEIEHLQQGLEDGVALCNLVEILDGKPIGKFTKQPKLRYHKIENINKALKALVKSQIDISLIAGEDIADGNIKLILGLLWRLIHKYQRISEITVVDESTAGAGGVAKTAEAGLLLWVRNQVKSYDLTVSNFTTSFQDGKVFAALVHKYDESYLDFASITDNAQENLERAFTAAKEQMGIPALIDATDMLQAPDDKSVVLYVSLIYQVFSLRQQQEETKTKLEGELSEAQQQMLSEQEELARLQKSKGEVVEELYVLRRKYETETAAREELQKAKDEADARLAEQQVNFEHAWDRLQEEKEISSKEKAAREAFEAELATLKASIADLTSQNKALERRTATLEEDVSAKQAEIDRWVQRSESDMAQDQVLTEQLKQTRQQLEEETKSRRAAEEKTASLEDKLATTLTTLDGVSEEKQSLAKQVESLQEQVDTQAAVVSGKAALEEELEESNARVADQEKQLAEALAEIDKLKAAVSEALWQVKAGQTTRAALERYNKIMENNLDELQKKTVGQFTQIQQNQAKAAEDLARTKNRRFSLFTGDKKRELKNIETIEEQRKQAAVVIHDNLASLKHTKQLTGSGEGEVSFHREDALALERCREELDGQDLGNNIGVERLDKAKIKREWVRVTKIEKGKVRYTKTKFFMELSAASFQWFEDDRLRKLRQRCVFTECPGSIAVEGAQEHLHYRPSMRQDIHFYVYGADDAAHSELMELLQNMLLCASYIKRAGNACDGRVVAAFSNPSAKMLVLDDSPIDRNGMRVVLSLTHRLQWVHTISLANANIGDQGLTYLMGALQSSEEVAVEDSASLEAIADDTAAQRKESEPERADSGDEADTANEDTAEGNAHQTPGPPAGTTTAIAKKATTPPASRIKFLSLEQNGITDKGIFVLAQTIENNRVLETLRLDANAISDMGLKMLANSLRGNTAIKALELAHNNVGDAGVVDLADAFLGTPGHSLELLGLNANSCKDGGATLLGRLIAESPSLTALSLARNVVGNEGAIAIAEGIKKSKTLRFLSLQRNEMSNSGACALSAALQECPSMQSVELSGNAVLGGEAANIIAAAGKSFVFDTLSIRRAD